MIELKNNNNRIIINPVEDILLDAGVKYLSMLSSTSDDAKIRQYKIFLQLLEIEIDSGEKFEWPTEEQLPNDHLLKKDNCVEDQSIQLVGKVVTQLIHKRNSRY